MIRALIFIGFLSISFSVFAKDSGSQLRLSIGKGICGKAPSALDNGPRKATLKKKRNTLTHSGPSVVCKSLGRVNNTESFMVTGVSKSTFGKLWYLIRVGDETLFRWVPAKHIELGRPIVEDVDPTIVAKIEFTPTRNLRLRKCPHLGCPAVGTIEKGKQYSSTKRAENGWYQVSNQSVNEGWANGQYIDIKEKITELAEPAVVENTIISQDQNQPARNNESTSQVKNQTINAVNPAPQFDPCKVQEKFTYNQNKHAWQVKQEFLVSKVPHPKCGLEFKLEKGKALISVGETEHYYILLSAPGSKLVWGYLQKESFSDQYVYRESINSKTDVFAPEMVSFLHEREAYWKSFGFKANLLWQTVTFWVNQNRATSLCLLALILGSLMLIFTRSRHWMLRADQGLLRTGYFFVRSNEFWRMLRRLLFIIVVGAAVAAALTMYTMWLLKIANQRQMIMGFGSLGLMSLSVGMFGARVAGFFTGLGLFFVSLFEFILFVLFLGLLFLLPSLLLLGGYYWVYRKGRSGNTKTSVPFSKSEIERIHKKIFRLRNFYPETVINWARQGDINERWRVFKDATLARTTVFDGFFDSVNGTQKPI